LDEPSGTGAEEFMAAVVAVAVAVVAGVVVVVAFIVPGTTNDDAHKVPRRARATFVPPG
jgi:hypothetical protein